MCTIDVEATGKQIMKLRAGEDISVKEFADRLHVSIQTVYHWQRGISVPTLDTLVILSELYDVPIDGLVVRSA